MKKSEKIKHLGLNLIWKSIKTYTYDSGRKKVLSEETEIFADDESILTLLKSLKYIK